MHSFEAKMTTKSGEERYALASAALVDLMARSVIWASNDITEAKTRRRGEAAISFATSVSA
jgi:hypothetical protein